MAYCRNWNEEARTAAMLLGTSMPVPGDCVQYRDHVAILMANVARAQLGAASGSIVRVPKDNAAGRASINKGQRGVSPIAAAMRWLSDHGQKQRIRDAAR